MSGSDKSPTDIIHELGKAPFSMFRGSLELPLKTHNQNITNVYYILVDAGAEFIEHKREELAHTFHDVADEASKTVSNLSSKAHSTAESTASHTFSDVTETVTHAFSDVKEKISEVIADHDDVTTEVKDILEKAVTPNPGVSEKMPPYE